MATRYAVVTGNWSSLATWDGGASLPGSSDDVYADGKTVTIDQDVTVNTLRTTQRSGGTTGGGFILNSGCVLTCNGTPGFYCGVGNGYVLTCNYNSPASASVVCTMNATGFPTNDAKAIALTGTGTLNFTGTFVTGPLNTQYGFNITAAATLNITGAITGGGNSTTRNSPVVLCSNAATITIIGNASAGESAAISNSGAATITVTGTVTASAGSPAIVNSVSSAVLKVSGPLVNNGKMMAVQSPVLQIGAASTYWRAVDYSNVTRNLYTADYLGGNPSVANVRHGTTFGPVGELTGTCYVPGAASVLAGVPVDATVGTVTLTAADIRNALGMASANLDTQLSGIHTKTTNLPASPAAEGSAMTLTPAYDPAKTAASQASVNAIPTTPLLATNYTAPPSASAIRAELDTNSTMLANLAAAVAGLHNFNPSSDIVARVALVDTTTDLTNGGGGGGGDPGEIADAVRVELAPELASILSIETRLEEQVPTGPAVAIPAPSVGQTTAWAVCYDETGQPEEGATITIACVKATADGAFDATPTVLTSDENGLASGPIPRGEGLIFTAKRGTGKPVRFVGVDADTLALPPLLGTP